MCPHWTKSLWKWSGRSAHWGGSFASYCYGALLKQLFKILSRDNIFRCGVSQPLQCFSICCDRSVTGPVSALHQDSIHQGELRITDQSWWYRIYHDESQLLMHTLSMIWLPCSSLLHNANMLWERHLLLLNSFIACSQLSFGISVVVTCFLYIAGKALLIKVFLKVGPSDLQFISSFISFVQTYWWSLPEPNTTLW